MFDSQGRPEDPPLQLLSHRGPDGRGHWRSADGRLVFGQTRLAIQDLSPAGAQPMIDAATGNVIVFNGEIYNHHEIRAELGARVPQWRGTSDTETILSGYAVFGSDLWPRLKGMFALLLFDAARGQLVVVRDRLGIKPLYYFRDANRLAFCSETRPLLDLVPGKVTRERVAAFLRTGCCPEEKLLLEPIQTLAAAHEWIIDLQTGAGTPRRFWTPPGPAPRRPADPAAPAVQVRRLLERAVREHMLSDVPVASFLSGGVDSSIVTALAARETGTPLRTYSVGFAEREFDETEAAAEVASHCGTEHRRIELSEDEVLAMVTEGVQAMDLPSVDAINTYVVSRAVARDGVKVALSGLGGDELFGGYPSFTDVPKLQRIARLPGVVRKLATLLGEKGRRVASMPATTDAAELAAWRRTFWTPEMLASAGLPEISLPAPQLPAWADDFARVSWVEMSRYMREMLLRDSDQMSMAVSLELRVPLLDHELVEYVLSLPESQKRGRPGVKRLFIEAGQDLLPAGIFNRPKRGFALPMDAWMRGPLKPFVASGLQHLSTTGLLRADFLGSFENRFARRELHWTRLWSLVVLGQYLRKSAIGLETSRK